MKALLPIASVVAIVGGGVWLVPVLARAAPVHFLQAGNDNRSGLPTTPIGQEVLGGFAIPFAGMVLVLAFGVALAGISEIGRGPEKAENGRCPLCGQALAVGAWCNHCQLARDAAQQIYRAHRLEEARTPCGILVFLALVALVLAVFGMVWALTYI